MDGQPGRCARPGGSVRDRGVQLAGMRCVPGARGLDPLLDYLKYEGVLAESPAPASPVEVLVERYRRWLVADRGLAEATVVRYVKLARSVLRQRVTEDGRVENLAATDIVAFLSAESSPLSVGSTNGRVAELQALLKFLYVAGLAPQPLVTLVPPVAGWHDTGVPKANPAADVQRLLDSCDRPTRSVSAADGVGQRATESSQIGCTRDTGVCCSMNSLTRICQAVTPGSRQGRSRRATSYQPSSSAALTVIALHHRSAAQCPHA